MWQCSGSWDGNGAALACTRSALFTELLPLRSMQRKLAQCLQIRSRRPSPASGRKTLASFIEPSLDLVNDT